MVTSSTIGFEQLRRQIKSPLISIFTLLLTGGLLNGVLAKTAQANTISSLDFLGEVSLTGFPELSGITYDSSNDLYYSISDENASFYQLRIDLSGDTLNSVTDVASPTSLTGVTDLNSTSLGRTSIDSEGIALTNDGKLFISSEGKFTGQGIEASTITANPFINRFEVNGQQDPTAGSVLTLPNRYTEANSTATTGIRRNLGFENLSLTPDDSKLFSATEGPLKEDQTIAELLSGSAPQLRLLEFNQTGTAYDLGAEYLYRADPSRALVDLLAIDNDTLLSVERNPFDLSVQLYQVSLDGASNISQNAGLLSSNLDNAGNVITAVQKQLIPINLGSLSNVNYEGLTFGPTLSDGRQSIILVGDNNGTVSQETTFAALAVNGASQPPEPVPTPAMLPGLLGMGLATIRRRRINHESRVNER